MVTSKLGKFIAVWACLSGSLFFTGLIGLVGGVFPEGRSWGIAFVVIAFVFFLSIDAAILKWLYAKPKVKK